MKKAANLLHDINFHHLYYFWVTAREGSVSRAAERLLLAQPTVSKQLKALERSLGVSLFERRGRGLETTETGRLAFRYADGIFALGHELVEALEGGNVGRTVRLKVGVAMVVPKLLVHRLLAPLQTMEPPPTLVLTEDRPNRLMADLALHDVDVVLSDAPIPPGVSIRAYNHLLGVCPVSVFAAHTLLEIHGRDFPRCLDGAPILLPTAHAAMRSPLERWFASEGVRPQVVSEFQDSALMKVYGQEAAGYFVAPSAIEGEVCERYGVELVGRSPVADRFYAITLERRIKNRAISLLASAAHEELFG
jgi:LysR family transcriptional activator of nhaA